MIVALSRLHFPVTALGPGRRIGLWFQGCSIRCAGCISADTWQSGAGGVELDQVTQAIAQLADDADGLTVSGGEPFEQPAALAELLTAWRRLSTKSVLVFTGYEYTDVAGWLAEHPGLVDGLIAGPFDRHASQTLALRGSDNQQLHVLTELGSEFLAYDRELSVSDRRLDVMFDADGGAWFAGIPARDDFRLLRQRLKAAGHRVILSSDAAVSS